MPAPPRRFAPERAFPPYAFVPARSPHPVRDPAGHSYGLSPDRFGPPPDPADPDVAPGLRYVFDLFNFGYYWEAHEWLEHWWRQLPDVDPRRPFFHGLLHLAAAGVKARQGVSNGVRSHAGQAAGLLRRAADMLGGESPALFGLSLPPLIVATGALELTAHRFEPARALPTVEPVLRISLQPEGM